MTTPRILSLWLPHWPTDRLHRAARRRRSSTDDLPEAALVTAHTIGSRRLIAALSPGAAALGLHRGLPVAQAQARHPGLRIAAADHAADRMALLGLARWCVGLTPHVALCTTDDAPPDGLWLDVSGSAPLYGRNQSQAERRLQITLLRRLGRLGITARIGIADTPGAAHALARYTPGLTDPGLTNSAPTNPARTVLTTLPVAALRLDPMTCDRLERLGLARIGDVAALPRAPLERRFGRNRIAESRTVLRRLDQMFGRVREPLPWIPPAGVITARRHAFDPLVTAAGLSLAIGELAVDLADQLRASGQGALLLELRLERCDNTVQALSLGLAAPSADAHHLARLFAARLDELDPGEGVETLHLTIRRRARLHAHQHGLSGVADTVIPIGELIDTLSHSPGLRALWRPAPRESSVPERAFARTPAMNPPDATSSSRTDGHLPRPIRLLDPPCPIQTVAELPDAPPALFIWQGRRHRVRRADGPERIAGEWWEREGERCAVRDYFQVEDEAGRRFWLFRRGDGQQPVTGDLSWFIHGVF